MSNIHELTNRKDMSIYRDSEQLQFIVDRIQESGKRSLENIKTLKCLTCEEKFNNAFDRCADCRIERKKYVKFMRVVKNFYFTNKMYFTNQYIMFGNTHSYIFPRADYDNKLLYYKIRIINNELLEKRNRVCDYLNLYVLHIDGKIDEKYLIDEILKFVY